MNKKIEVAMKKKAYKLMALLAMGLAGCHDYSAQDRSQEVVSQRFIHKYGYDVSQEEWQGNHYPGQVITTMRNGVTITSTYEDGILHGSTTYTYPHSETLESLNIFEGGVLVRKVNYDVKGLPEKEELFFGPDHVKVTCWYKSGPPRCIEEYLDDELIEGDYFTLHNESESRVTKGYGERIIRDSDGWLWGKEIIDEGHIALRESFHPNGTLHSSIPFAGGTIHGEKRVFGSTGEPVSIETYQNGYLSGPASYFQNGVKYLELSFKEGRKNGVERYYIDGSKLVEECNWSDGLRHGLSIVYLDGMTKKEWYFANERVTKSKFDELIDRDRAIAIMNERAYRHAQ
ncbi:MAG: hypothetical protein WDZ28_04505 [Simkaniaceae bacterium]